jgi:two-component system, cell cycle response regulator
MGVNDYLMRPIDRHELLARVKTQIKRKRHSDFLRHRLEETVEQSITDGLTGLHNRRYMESHLKTLVTDSLRTGRALSMLIADIDYFKKVNDTYGHDVGDQVIKGLGEILKRQKRTTDVVARFGGEEFVLLCEQTDEPGSFMLAERIREELAKTVFTSPQGPFSVTCSVGVATFPEAGGKWDDLFKAADEALYASKRGGRNKVSVWAPPSMTRIKTG